MSRGLFPQQQTDLSVVPERESKSAENDDAFWGGWARATLTGFSGNSIQHGSQLIDVDEAAVATMAGVVCGDAISLEHFIFYDDFEIFTNEVSGSTRHRQDDRSWSNYTKLFKP